MSKIATLTVGNVASKIIGIENDDVTRLKLSNAMSYVVDGHEHMGAGGWDGRTSMFDWETCKFPSGFSLTASKVLKAAGYQVKVRRKKLPEPLGEKPTPDNPIVDDFAPMADYGYQFETVDKLERFGSFICRAATGAGKSRIAKLCIQRIGRKTLFLTTRQVLLYQMGEALQSAGFKISYVGDGSWDTSGDVVLGMVQTLNDRLTPPKLDGKNLSKDEVDAKLDRWELRNEQARDLLSEIEFVIGEEAHEAGGAAYFEVLKHCKKAAYRLALTATPLMRDGESNMRLIGAFGPIRIQVSEEYLINCGILATPRFKFIDLPVAPNLKRSTNWQKAEQLGIYEYALRNKYIVAECKRAQNWNIPAMVLVKRQKHGKLLCQMMRNNGIRAEWIFGESNQDERKRVLTALKEGQIDVVIGSTILDVGVDVPAIGLLVLAGGGKAEVAHRQRNGRGLRAKVGVPNYCYIVDFQDRGNKHLIKHYKQRRAILEQTPGFAENILPPNTDFNFAQDGFVRPEKKLAA